MGNQGKYNTGNQGDSNTCNQGRSNSFRKGSSIFLHNDASSVLLFQLLLRNFSTSVKLQNATVIQLEGDAAVTMDDVSEIGEEVSF